MKLGHRVLTCHSRKSTGVTMALFHMFLCLSCYDKISAVKKVYGDSYLKHF